MIITTEIQDIKTHGVQEQTQSSIIMNAQMYKLLSSSLYTNKILAVLRELSANAIDAMRDAGTLETHSFEVHLPTALESFFAIRDYGTGLSDDGIKAVYINFGASTKNGENSSIGGFGVGSKSVLSYTNDCVITSFHNGMKTVYNFGLSSEMLPVLSKVISIPTDEHNGLRIQMATLAQDRTQFEREAVNLYQWFKYKPKTNVELKFPEIETLMETDKFILSKTNSYNSSVKVLMGNIMYPINSYSTITGFPYVPSGYTIVFIVNIGEIDVTASRESVELTPRTVKTLQGLIIEFKDVWVKQALGDLDSTDITEYDKYKRCYDDILFTQAPDKYSRRTFMTMLHTAKVHTIDGSYKAFKTTSFKYSETTREYAYVSVNSNSTITPRQKDGLKLAYPAVTHIIAFTGDYQEVSSKVSGALVLTHDEVKALPKPKLVKAPCTISPATASTISPATSVQSVRMYKYSFNTPYSLPTKIDLVGYSSTYASTVDHTSAKKYVYVELSIYDSAVVCNTKNINTLLAKGLVKSVGALVGKTIVGVYTSNIPKAKAIGMQSLDEVLKESIYNVTDVSAYTDAFGVMNIGHSAIQKLKDFKDKYTITGSPLIDLIDYTDTLKNTASPEVIEFFKGYKNISITKARLGKLYNEPVLENYKLLVRILSNGGLHPKDTAKLLQMFDRNIGKKSTVVELVPTVQP